MRLSFFLIFAFSIVLFSCSDDEEYTEQQNSNQNTQNYIEFKRYVDDWVEPSTYSFQYRNGRTLIVSNPENFLNWLEHYAKKSPGEVSISYKDGIRISITGDIIDSINKDYEFDKEIIKDSEFYEEELADIEEKRENQISAFCFCSISEILQTVLQLWEEEGKSNASFNIEYKTYNSLSYPVAFEFSGSLSADNNYVDPFKIEILSFSSDSE